MAYFGNSQSDNVLRRVEPKTIFLVLWIVLCGIVLTFILRSGSKESPAPAVAAVAEADPAVAYVVVAKSAIAAGQKITSDLFTLEQRQIRGINESVFRKPAELEGAYAVAPIQDNSPILKELVTYTLPSNAVTSKIPDGFRAITIPVDAESGVEGWVRAGARVDVLWISTIRDKPIVSTIVEDVEVLSAERSTDTNGADVAKTGIPSHVTLLASAGDAQRIQLAKRSGTLSLNLRGTTDRSAATGGGTITLDGLLNKDGQEQDLDNVGWVQLGSQAYDITSTGKFKPSQDKKKREALFNR